MDEWVSHHVLHVLSHPYSYPLCTHFDPSLAPSLEGAFVTRRPAPVTWPATAQVTVPAGPTRSVATDRVQVPWRGRHRASVDRPRVRGFFAFGSQLGVSCVCIDDSLGRVVFLLYVVFTRLTWKWTRHHFVFCLLSFW